MDLYLNDSKKYKIIIDGVIYNLQLYTTTITGDRLFSSDDFILQDIYGIYLQANEEE